jgi:iron complex transport system ATP-binding protein
VTVVSVENVRVTYGNRVAVAGFTDELHDGEWLCLIGPNGAGKSSVLRSILGLARHTGRVSVDGVDLATLSPRRRAQLVAYVPQNPLLPDDMSVFEYALLGRNPYVAPFATETVEDRHVVADVLIRLDLDSMASRRLGTLSGGERQRLVIARALAQQAPVLLLDEPTSALDVGHQQQALELVDRLRHEHGLTVISAMHDLTLAGLYSDRLALIHEGRVVASGAAAAVLRVDTLHQFYGVTVRILHDDDGTVVVVPSRRIGAAGM